MNLFEEIHSGRHPAQIVPMGIMGAGKDKYAGWYEREHNRIVIIERKSKIILCFGVYENFDESVLFYDYYDGEWFYDEIETCIPDFDLIV